MSKSKEIRLLNDRLDYYTMEVEDDQFDAEEVIRILKRLDELEPLPEPDMSAEESLEAFWEYVKEREREEKLQLEDKVWVSYLTFEIGKKVKNLSTTDLPHDIM